MKWFFGSKPRDPGALWLVLSGGTYDEFLSQYDSAWVNYQYDDQNLLAVSLTNPEPDSRLAIANKLMDDGATVHSGHPLHVLLAQGEHDFNGESKLLERLIEAGVDINEVVPRQGAPIETLARSLSFSDQDLAPFYDVFFAQDNLDLNQHGLYAKPIIDGIRAKGALRVDLARRGEEYMARSR